MQELIESADKTNSSDNGFSSSKIGNEAAQLLTTKDLGDKRNVSLPGGFPGLDLFDGQNTAKAGTSAPEKIGNKEDADWASTLKGDGTHAASEARIHEAVQAVYKDNSPVGKMIQADFEKHLKTVNDADVTAFGLNGKSEKELVDAFNEELLNKPNTNCYRLATIVHALRPSAQADK